MNSEIITVLVILAVAFIFFMKEWLPVDVVGLMIVLALVFTETLDIRVALQGFGHPAVIGVGALFVVSEGLLRTGALGVVANRLERWSHGREILLRIYMLTIVAASSAFLNNTPVVAMFIPVVLGLSLRMNINPSRLLIPLSYAAILGGTCTLIGTSTNIMVASIVGEMKAQNPELLVSTPKMFDFTKLGVLVTCVGLLYLFVFSRFLLPDRQTITSMTAAPSRRLREYVTELAIRPGGSIVEKKVSETLLATTPGIRMIQIIRGESILWPPLDNLLLRAGDALVIAGRIEDLMELHKESDLQTLDEILAPDEVEVSSKETELAEILVQPNSVYVGKTLEEAQFRLHFKVNVLAIQRHGMHLRKKISEHPLRVGDLLLVQGTEPDLQRLKGEEGLVLMSEVNEVLIRRDKAPIALAILAAVIGSLTLTHLPMASIALAGAIAMVLTGCLSAGRIYESIHWRVLVLIGGTLALGTALQTSGTAEWIATHLVDLFRSGGPHVLLVVTLILTALLTEAVSNTAVAAIMIPIAIQISQRLEVDGTGFIMAVAFGASCSFLTPIGYQTNTLVYGAGGYKFFDFTRIGLPLVLLVWGISSLMIPLIWPF